MTDSLQRVWTRLTFIICVTCLIVATAEATPNLRGKGYILNNGLWPSNVLAVALGSDVDVWVTKTGMIYDHHGITNGRRRGVVSKATWSGARAEMSTVAVGSAEATSVTFFKNANVPSNPHARIATKLVSGFIVKDVYPGVDVDYKMDEGNVRFDILTKRAELASAVKLSFEGLNVKLFAEGNDPNFYNDMLFAHDDVASTQYGNSFIGFKNLKAFQNGKEVAVSFVRDGQSNAFAFSGDFAPSQPLIIDPTVYGTYLGGPDDDMLAEIAALANGDVVVGGTTTQIDFPASLGKYDAENSGTSDGFVAIFDAALTMLKGYTYIGGPDPDSVKAITTDATNNVYAAGTTLSATFPITGGTAGQIYRGSTDAYALKLSPDLSSLVFSTFIGGNKEDIALDIAVDGDLSVYVCGATNSTTNFPTNAGFDKTFGGQIDGFLTKLSSSGASYTYSTYMGVEGNEQFNAVVVEISGSPILTGFTNSTGYPTFPTPSMFQPNRRPYDRTIEGTSDAFVTKFGQDGGTLVYSTFFGGNGDEDGKGILVDDLGRAYLVGETTSTNLPATAGFQQTRTGGRDVFLFVLSADGKELDGCTYYGGTGDERVRSVARGRVADNAVVVGGVTGSNDLPVAGAGTNPTRRGVSDAFIANFTIGALKYADIIGGNGLDTITSVSVDVNDDVYACGVTTSADLKYPALAYQKAKLGGIDGFMLKSAKGTIELTAPDGGDNWCLGSNQTVSWSASEMAVTDVYRIDVTTDDGATWIEVAKNITARSYAWKPMTLAPGNYKLRVTANRGQMTMTSTTFRLGPMAAITTQPTPVAVCEGAPAAFTVVASGEELKYKWRKDNVVIPTATSATISFAAVTPANAGSYTVEVTGKCGAAVLSPAVTLKIETNPTITSQPMTQTIEAGKPLTLSVTSSIAASRYQWKKNGTDIPGATSREYSIPTTVLSDAGEYSVSVITDCGTVNSAVAIITITPASSVREVRLASGLVKLVGEMPVSELCTVEFDLSDYSEVAIELLDIQGATTSVAPIRLMHTGGRFTIDVPCGNLASGSYLLDVTLNGHHALLPLVVAR